MQWKVMPEYLLSCFVRTGPSDCCLLLFHHLGQSDYLEGQNSVKILHHSNIIKRKLVFLASTIYGLMPWHKLKFFIDSINEYTLASLLSCR